MKRVDAYHLVVEKHGAMQVDATIIASEAIQVEEDAVLQLEAAASLPTVARVVATPDIHIGFGVPIGCVAGVKDYIVPAAVGYDINCGMRIVRTPFEAKGVDIEKLAYSFRRDIPLGEGKRNVRLSKEDLRKVLAEGLRGLRKIRVQHERLREGLSREELDEDIEHAEEGGSMEGDPDAVSSHAMDRGQAQLGTLGGGNHFIEIQRVDRIEDEKVARRFGLFEGQLVVMIHSGSRGLGHQVCTDSIRKGPAIPSIGGTLRYLHADSEDGKRYAGAMRAAANYAFANRQFLAALVRINIRRALGEVELPIVYDVPHNMAKLEDGPLGKLWVHRKGATRAFPAERMKGTEYEDVGQPVLIPGSMGTASYVLVGTREAEATLYSVNHGAGRVMSRTAARGRKGRGAAISDEEFRESMKGVLLLAENLYEAKEEAPAAYKDIDAVIDSVVGAGLARAVARMVPLAVLKG
ncbi:MAG: RtcB family protein [Planctomycetota bacterium]